MQSKTLSLILTALLLLILSIGASGCNTISGAGQDIEAAGDAIEDEAEENKTY